MSLNEVILINERVIMYTEREGFTPVTLVLETQKEVDALYVILNFVPFIIKLFNQLRPYRSIDYEKIHERLNKLTM